MAYLQRLIAPFIDSVATGRTDVYNEFSLQHELGHYLRAQMPGRKVQFERNVTHFFGSKSDFTKREIDISIFAPDIRELDWAIELKFPRNGQVPEQMFSFCKDIAFVEELRSAGFADAGLVILAEDPLFYRGSTDGIYGFFQGGLPLSGPIQKPTGRRDEEVTLRGFYTVKWTAIAGSLKYAVIEVAA
jgi:hypothetical protein